MRKYLPSAFMLLIALGMTILSVILFIIDEIDTLQVYAYYCSVAAAAGIVMFFAILALPAKPSKDPATIIKAKQVNTTALFSCIANNYPVKTYNDTIYNHEHKLTEEEFEILENYFRK